MKLTKEDLKEKKSLIIGLTGSGKTELAKVISRPLKTMIYTPHITKLPGGKIKSEWMDQDVTIYLWDNYKADMEGFCLMVKNEAIKGNIEHVVFDELDLLTRTNFDIPESFFDLLINHRHFGRLSITGIARRPQSTPTAFYEEIHNIYIFNTESPNATKKLNSIFEGLGDKAKTLQKYEFIFKQSGNPDMPVQKLRLKK